MENTNMDNTNTTRRNPYRMVQSAPAGGPAARLGMSLAEMISSLVLMAVLSLGMIWLLWSASR